MKTYAKLSLVLCLSALLLACGEQEKKPDSTKPVATGGDAGTVAETESETEEPGYKPAEKDLGGMTFRIVLTDDLDDAQQTMYHEELDGEPINDALHIRDTEVQEMLNVKLEYDPSDNLHDNEMRANIIKLVEAGEDVYDMVICSAWYGIGRCDYTQVYMDLLDIPGLSLEESWWNKSVYDNLRMKGKLYFSICPISPMYYGCPTCVFYNKEMAQNHDLDNFYEMVFNGEWTIDALFKTAYDIAEDVNGDGKRDYGTDIHGLRFADFCAYVVGCGIHPVVIHEESYVSHLEDDKLITLVQKLGPYMQDGEHFNMGGPAKPFQEGYVLFYQDCLRSAWGKNGMRNSNMDYGILPMPKYDTDQENYYSCMNNIPVAAVAVPKTVDTIEESGLIMEAMAFYSNKYIRPATYETTLMGKLAQDVESQQILELIYNSAEIDLVATLNTGTINSVLFTQSVFQGRDYSSTYKKKSKNIKKALTDLLGPEE